MSQPLSILHLHPGFARVDRDGWSARMVRVMRGLGDRARHRVVAEVGRDALPADVRCEVVQDPPPLSGGASVARYEAIARAMRGHDLVLSWGAGAIDGVMARRAFPRGAPPIVHHEDPPARDDGAGARLYRRLALGAAHALVVSGPAAAEAAQRRWKVPAGRVHAIPAGVDLAVAPDAARIAGWERRTREVVIGVVAALTEEAGVPALVRAVGGLSGRVRLVIVGEGPDRAAIERAALAMGIDDRVVLTGAVDDAAALLPGFDLLALPPRPGRAPVVVVEAMAAGLAVVGPNVGDIGALVAAENVAHLTEHAGEVRLRDAMQVLVSDAGLRAQIGAANRARAEAVHDAGRMIAESAALYAAAAGAAGRPG